MMLDRAVFWSLAAVTLGSALGVVLLRNVFHSALLLGLCLLGVAGLFASLAADFLFAAQILIYVGGIAVLILFVVLLAGRASELHMRQTNRQWAAALAVCAVTYAGMARYISPFRTARALPDPQPTTLDVGRLMLSDLAVPFELVTLVLLAALVGAVLFSKPEAGGAE